MRPDNDGWLIPVSVAIGLGLVVAVLHAWTRRRQVDKSKVYRARFVQLVSQLDTVTHSVNQLGAQVRSIGSPQVLDYYESSLRMLETLLTAIRKIPPFGSDPNSLESAFFLVRECRHRIGRTQQAFQDVLKGREVNLQALYGHPDRGAKLPEGCYFCSRPVVVSRFSKVKVKIDDEVLEVLSCRICKEELESTRKVKVLYFMKDGKPVHWSAVEDYSPSEDFWDINKRDPVRKERRLELVTSEKPLNPD